LQEIIQGIWPFILILAAGLIVVMLVPELSLWLTRFVG
jgi:TRAP-type C4-dicarboxylate transport system permease large subunit